ncbi:asparagine synthase (glutamine-hydrolyzing) [Alkalicella caledoniensis]|uniref:asparagine synthase (glutamine-hydrolyzing) n=1 Tax=Alkalicella caledoniensis TaxID=2731377 RepID=A0A7G9W7C0_ALKCA|nr:asparagine synthase (glutamine-hydrolyzing) [Alkalicella caledoniensis]QNO14582.1 asparagine synthase (glutamine-hydrolyzing) [Alkalicella caledoniensis]
MCGITGWINLKSQLPQNTEIIKDMTNSLSKRGPDEEGYYIDRKVHLGHKRLTVVDPSGGKQPMIKKYGDKKYTIIYNGELYNTEEIRRKLLDKGHQFKSYSDTEVLLTSYMEWGENCLQEFNGIYAFAIWDEYKNSLFMARDPLGVKPLFYSIIGNDFLLGSEIKALLKHPDLKPEVNSEGLSEIFGLGPARSLGSAVFKNIKELPPAHSLLLDSSGITVRKFWDLEAREHTDSLEVTVEKVRELLLDSIKRQLISDVPVCIFLSGGLDSSAISKVASDAFKEKGQILKTFSIDYQDNDKYFKSSVFQPNSDGYWAKLMSKNIGSEHYNIVLTQDKLVKALENAVKANDLPGMADMDASLYLFSEEVRKQATVGLSGECADEIFGGYPWYTNKDMQNTGTFPWSPAIKERQNILSRELALNLPLEAYVNDKYQETINRTPKLMGESKENSRLREIFYLNLKWFMVTLLNRKDRMTMANSLEVRVPFADYRLVEYCFNIPNAMKFTDNREKGLLRRALKGILPNEIVDRKKSPYPKTFHPEYTKLVQKWMGTILADSSSPILQLIDFNQVQELVKTGGKSFEKPWYGQLMTGPQLIAYLIQIDLWMREYKVTLVN